MVATDTKEKQITFHNQDLYSSIKIPVREYLLELTNDLELAVLLNQIIFSKKEKMTLNDIKRLSLNEKTKQTIRVKLEKLIELGLIRKHKNNAVIFNQDLYEPTEKIISDNQNILALIEGNDLKYDFHYLTAIILNKFRTYALSDIKETRVSVRQLKSMLGVGNSESSIRATLKQLIQDDYIDAELVYGIYNYKINISKITNHYSLDDINKFTDIIFMIYREYLKHLNTAFKSSQFKSYKMTIKRMLLNGYDPLILKHIFTFITLNRDDFKEPVTPANIKKSYNRLYNLSKALSKKKAKRFLYKLQHHLLNNNPDVTCDEKTKSIDNGKNKLSDMELWYKAVNYVAGLKGTLQKWYYDSVAGVTDIDFDDFYQETVKSAFIYLKKHPNSDLQPFNVKYIIKDYMYDKRAISGKFDGKNAIINFEYEVYDLDKYQCPEQNESPEIDFENNPGINKLLSALDDRSKYIVKHYLGYDGHSLTFKEIGNKLNLSESLIARTYKKAILLLKEKFPPGTEWDIRKLINGCNTKQANTIQ